MKTAIRKMLAKALPGLGLLLGASIVLCCVATVLAGTSISARYLQPRGAHIEWTIDIPSPPPAAVIVTQYILPGSDILESSHPLSSYDKGKGIAKWLLTSIAPGSLKMEMSISEPITKKGEIHGEVMFQDEAQRTTASSIFMNPRTMKKAVEGC